MNSNRKQFGVATIMLFTVVIALAIGWWVDRSSLKTQIPSPPRNIMKTYAIKHGSLDLVAAKLNEVFGIQIAIPYPAINSLIVNTEHNAHEQIQLMLKHLDRDGTEYAKKSQVVPSQENQ